MIETLVRPQIGEIVLRQQGSYKRVQRFYPGWFKPEGGIAGVNYTWHFGWSGKETIIEKDVITPIGTFNVK